jgi:hypothetical protein
LTIPKKQRDRSNDKEQSQQAESGPLHLLSRIGFATEVRFALEVNVGSHTNQSGDDGNARHQQQ